MDTIEQFLSKNAGIASVSEISALIDESEGRVRAWARENSDLVRRLGSTFAFTGDAIEQMLTDFEEADEEEDDEDDEDEDDVAASGGDDDAEDDEHDDDEEED